MQTLYRMIELALTFQSVCDPYETGSKVDYPRMKEGGLDAVFLRLSSLKIFETTTVMNVPRP